ncbi:MAG: hypothetical protein CBB69_012720 [Phycisphaera sp. TMED9]|nr:MAG: hypothetical protein CBB69_012720 [Phycisphaera sp. TMED9]
MKMGQSRRSGRFTTVIAFLAAAVAGVFGSSAAAEVEVIALDFGAGRGAAPVYTGEFDGTDGFIGFGISADGVVESPSMDIGNGVTLSFTNVSGWNNSNNDTADIDTLLWDHIFSASLEADDPVAFDLTGLDADDIVVLEFLDKLDGSAMVTFNGLETLVDANGLGFVDVSGGGVTGSTSYSGSFTGASGSGEGNLAAARIIIISEGGGGGGAGCPGDFNDDGIVDGADFGFLLGAWGKCGGCPEDLNEDGFVNGADIGAFLVVWGDCPDDPGVTGACCLGMSCYDVSSGDCADAGGDYGGDGSVCTPTSCDGSDDPADCPDCNCCEANGGTNCSDAACTALVCDVDPACCLTGWDSICAGLAETECNACDGTTPRMMALDFGTGGGNGPVFAGTFDGTSGFVGFEISENGVVESPSMDIGDGVTLTFTNVSGWNNSNGNVSDVDTLIGDHFFCAALDADDPVAFEISGLDPAETVVLEFVDRRGTERALVTFEGATTLVDNDFAFTDVSGGGVTGSTSYSGFFTGGDGSGEGNLSGARIFIYAEGQGGGGGGGEEGLCPDCNCCEPNGDTSCSDPGCTTLVCNVDPICCEFGWDTVCAGIAEDVCNECDGTAP